MGIFTAAGRRPSRSRGRSVGMVKPAGKRRYRGRGLGVLSPPGKRRGTRGWRL